MAPEKVTKMVLDVDLKCSDCYKKVKKILCKIPQVRDQEYDVEKNKVKIAVVCCSPEKIKDKLCYKGGSSIQKIEVVVEKPKDSKPSGKDAGKDSGKPKGKEDVEAPPQPKKTEPKPEVARMMVEPVHGYPQMCPPNYPVVGYGYQGYGHYGGSYPAAAQPSGSGYGYGYGHGHGYDHGYNGNAIRNDYFSEENPNGCSVM